MSRNIDWDFKRKPMTRADRWLVVKAVLLLLGAAILIESLVLVVLLLLGAHVQRPS